MRIGRNGLVPPQPSHHLGHDGAAHGLAMPIHSPGVVHLVSLFCQRFHQTHILIKPVACLIISAVGVESAVVVSSILQEYANRFLLALEYDIGIRMTSPDVRKTSDDAENLPEVIRALPRYSERGDRTGTRSTNAM